MGSCSQLVATLNRQLWDDSESGRTCQGRLPVSIRTTVKAQAPKPLKMFLARNERLNHQCGSVLESWCAMQDMDTRGWNAKVSEDLGVGEPLAQGFDLHLPSCSSDHKYTQGEILLDSW